MQLGGDDLSNCQIGIIIVSPAGLSERIPGDDVTKVPPMVPGPWQGLLSGASLFELMSPWKAAAIY